VQNFEHHTPVFKVMHIEIVQNLSLTAFGDNPKQGWLWVKLWHILGYKPIFLGYGVFHPESCLLVITSFEQFEHPYYYCYLYIQLYL
jgi:hypothetical protein